MGDEDDEVGTIEALAAAVVRIAREFDADVVLTFTETGRTYHLVRGLVGSSKPRVIAATLNPKTFEELRSSGASVVMVPASAFSRIGEIQHAISRGLQEGIVSQGDLLVCLIGARLGADADTIFIHQATGSEPEIAQLVVSNPALEAVITLAVQLGREGVEGRPVGTSFVVGDEQSVMGLSHQIGINPFKGYSISVLDRKNWYLIKRYAMPCEGAFVVGSDGVIVAADRYLRAEDVEVDIPSGFGTRHRAIARVTAATKAVGVVVSEGDRQVRIFQGGRLVGTINPLGEAWLET